MSGTTLAFDQGGTKLAAALVDGDTIVERTTRPTRREAGPDGWIDDMVAIARAWDGRFETVGVAATGHVHEGIWSALNRKTLDIDEEVRLVERLRARLGKPVLARNDAQAAAWGEYRFGAARSADMAFITVSTGVGGGLVLNGRLVSGHAGLAGHVGQIPVSTRPLEDDAGGRSIAAAAAAAGHAVDARRVFDAATGGAVWAEGIVAHSARRIARLCETLQAILDLQLIVVGGSIGLADGYLARVDDALAPCVHGLRPSLVRAARGADAGLLGIADLASS